MNGRDASGCLTPASLDLVARAAPGQAPPELAEHLARCGRCQDRMLSLLRPAGPSSKRRGPPPLWRLVAVAVGLVVLGLLALLLAAARR